MPDGTRETYQTLVNPEMPIPAEATTVHGITDADVADAPAASGSGSGDPVEHWTVATWPASIACDSMCPSLRRNCTVWVPTGITANLRIVDVQRIYHKMEPRNLSAALKFYCGKEHEGAHDALADVEATADVLLAQLERYPDVLQGDVASLGELSGDRQRSPDAAGKLRFDDRGAVCLSFGKYAGWSLEKHWP
jgi:DNA polymerase-3 subunit epsilon